MKKSTTVSHFLWIIVCLLYSCKEEDAPAHTESKIILIKGEVKIEVGGILYENLDAQIKIKGYNSDHTIQWSKDFNFTGPTDTLEVQYGSHHYSIELLNKWGVHDIQAEIPAEQLWNGRADGPHPVTYVLSGSRKAKKLAMYVSYREVEIQGAGIVKLLESKTSYTYGGDGRLHTIKYEGYDGQTLKIIETTTQKFTYEGNDVSKIEVTVNGKLARDYRYVYGPANIIRETSHFNNGSWVQTNTQLYNNDTKGSVVYSSSNGRSFLWEFETYYRNIISDMTTSVSERCHEGHYTFDKNINPFRHLGYLDFNFENWDLNNALTEQVEYKACAYPSLIPVNHQYTYDPDGYPVKKITTYKGGFPDSENEPNSPYHSESEFYYN